MRPDVSPARSAGTPPLLTRKRKSANRASRSKSRNKGKRRNQSRTKIRSRHQRKRESYRSRSRRPISSGTSRRSSNASRDRSRHRYSRASRVETSVTSSTSTGSETGPSRRKARYSYKRRHRSSDISTSSSSSSNCSERRLRCRKRKSGTKHRTTSDVFFEKFSKLIDNRGTRFEGAQNVIPEFDPDTSAHTAAVWIRKVEETAKIYNWDKRQIIHYALPKLAGYAKTWYHGQSSFSVSWRQWKSKILKTFPDDRNYADRLAEMLDRRSRREESLEEYFHDKARLVRMCKIFGRDAVDCIVNGIFDNNIRLNAQGSDFRRPSQLLRYLRRISKRINIIKKPGQYTKINNTKTNDNNPNGAVAEKPTVSLQGRSKYRLMRCYNCKEIGHSASTCNKPIRRCDKCHRVGHLGHECRETSLPNKSFDQNEKTNKDDEKRTGDSSQKVLQISTEGKANGKYYKSATLNNKSCSAYIDFGSQCTLLKMTVAEELNLSLNNNSLPVMKGFAFGSITPIGRVSVLIVVDAVDAYVEVFVVADDLLTTDLLIGQSFTELPTVVVYKTSTQLTLYCDDSEKERINVYNAAEKTSIEGVNVLKVRTDTPYTGLVFIPGNLCMKTGCEYALLQGVYEFKDGEGSCLFITWSRTPIKLEKSKMVSRAVKLPMNFSINMQTTHLEVNTVTTYNNSKGQPNPVKAPITNDMINVGPKVSDEQKETLLQLLNKYRDCFALNMQELGLTNVSEMTIRLSDNTPVNYRPYRLPFSERAKVREMIGELMANDIVRESNSPYSSPIVLVRKKNNEYRLCVDYRALNKKTIKDSYPMPVIDDQLDRLSGNSWFTSLDLASGYYQIPVSEQSRQFTAFVTPDGHYEYTRMPFGIVNAPAVFQSMINKALGPRRFELAVPYLDDLLSSGSTFEEAFAKVEEILSLLRQAKLTLNLEKCFFFQTEINYLGYEISERGLRPGNTKVQAVSEFPEPSNVHQIRQFVGLASFFRRFVFNFATIVSPLTRLTKSDVPWTWGDVEKSAFQDIKSKLITRPILALYNPKYYTEVHCDASKVGVGGILLQRPDSSSPLRPVAYYSRQTTREEEFWHAYELETMAVVLSLKKFRVYVIGLEFTVVTDCNALRSTLTKRDLVPKIARWWLMLQEYNFSIEYRPGRNMQHVDALSRNPVLAPDNQEEFEVLNITTSDWLHTVQMTDPRLKHIKTILQTSKEDIQDITKNYVLRDDKLYRRDERKLKWVVPSGARWKICQLNHDDAGHFAAEKTLEKIRADYWFPKMKRFVSKYVAACINCAYNKEMTGKRTGYLHPIPKVNSVFHTIHMDHLGPFIKSKRGNTYIPGIIDGFSKFIFIRAVKNTKSKTTIKTLEEIFATFGSPKVIISDQGSSFTSNEFKSFSASIGVKHVLNAVATPRANGQIERYNRTILNSLASMNHGLDEKDWDINVPKLQWSLNNTINKGVGKSPSEIVFGQRTTGQSEGILKGALDQPEEEFVDKREEVRKDAQDNIINLQNQMKKRFDQGRAPTKHFREGDLVMIPNHNPDKGKSKKLAPKFRGPFKITTVLDKDRYVVTNIDGHSKRKYSNIFPADQSKSWITFQSSPSSSVGDESDSDESLVASECNIGNTHS